MILSFSILRETPYEEAAIKSMNTVEKQFIMVSQSILAIDPTH